MARAWLDILRGWLLRRDRRDPTTRPQGCLPHDVNNGTTPVANTNKQGTPLEPMQPPQARVRGPKILFQATARARSSHRNSLLAHLMDLPQELWLEILSYLDFGEMLRLRRTCKTVRRMVSKPTIHLLIPHWRRAWWSTCTVCLRYDPAQPRVFCLDRGTRYLPEQPECVECIARRNGFRVGSTYFMCRYGVVSVCRYCGRPVVTEPAPSNSEFHLACYGRHCRNMKHDVLFFVLYLMFFSVATYVCIWCDPRGSGVVVMLSMMCAITTLDGVMMVMNRKGLCSRKLRLYHFYATMNLFAGTFCLYIVAMDYTGHSSLFPRKRAQLWAAYFFICVSALWRIVKGLGNVVLTFEYKFWQHHKPHRSWARRCMSAVVRQLALIGDPECVLLEYPPKYGIECLRRRRR